MTIQRIGPRSLLLLAWLGCIGSASCSDDDDSETPRNYLCLVGAIVLTSFNGSCDTRQSVSSPGECRAWHGSSSAAASQACSDLGGNFNETERCPSANRVLRCAIQDTASVTIMHSYYAPTYTEASAADLCSSRGGKCVRGTGD